jgi:hypothetical protein
MRQWEIPMIALKCDQTTGLKELMKEKENFWFESFAIIITYNKTSFENRGFVIPAF